MNLNYDKLTENSLNPYLKLAVQTFNYDNRYEKTDTNDILLSSNKKFYCIFSSPLIGMDKIFALTDKTHKNFSYFLKSS